MDSAFRRSTGSLCNVTVNVNIYESDNFDHQRIKRRTIRESTHPQLDEIPEKNARYSESSAADNEASPSTLNALRSHKHLYEEHIGNTDYYQMNKCPKGRVLIINNTFEGTDNFRRGSENDVNYLKNLFIDFGGCCIDAKDDLNAYEIKQTVKKFAEIRADQGFCALFIMSHGRTDSTGSIDILVGNDQARINVKDIVDIFRSKSNPHLKDVPVLLFFQMCRGKKSDSIRHYKPVQGTTSRIDEDEYDDSDDGFVDCEKVGEKLANMLRDILPGGRIIGSSDVVDNDEVDAGPFNLDDDEAEETQEEHIAGEPNTLLSFATMQGYKAYRRGTGSWFIQEICRIFCKYAMHKDVVALLNDVHNEISEMTSQHQTDPNLRGLRMSSRTIHTFGEKKLYFFPGLP